MVILSNFRFSDVSHSVKLPKMKFYKTLIICLLFLSSSLSIYAQKGHDLWLQYAEITGDNLKNTYLDEIQSVTFSSQSETTGKAQEELQIAWRSFFGQELAVNTTLQNKALWLATEKELPKPLQQQLKTDFAHINEEGFLIKKTTI